MSLSSKRSLITIVTVVLSWVSLAYPPMPLFTLVADTAQYRAIRDTILEGTFFAPLDVRSLSHLAVGMRPPLFPLLLAASSFIPVSEPHALVTLHLVIALTILIAVPSILRNAVPPPVTALSTGIALYSAKQVLWGEVSEWLALCLLLGAVASLLSWAFRPSALAATATALFLACATLTRTALSPFFLFLPIMWLWAPRPLKRSTALSILVGLTPLVIWGGIQFHRIGAPSLGSYEGLNALATARSLGPLVSSNSDTAQMIQFVARVNERGVTTSPLGLAASAVHRWDGEFYAAFHHNFDLVCAIAQPQTPAPPPGALSVAVRSLRHNSETYLAFIRGGFATFTQSYTPLVIVTLIVATWLYRRGQSTRPIALVTVVVCCVTVVYLASIFATVLWLHRYFIPIQPSLIFVLGVSAASLCSSYLGDSRGPQQRHH